MRLPVNTVIHTTLVGLEPEPSDCWSDVLPVVPPNHRHIGLVIFARFEKLVYSRKYAFPSRGQNDGVTLDAVSDKSSGLSDTAVKIISHQPRVKTKTRTTTLDHTLSVSYSYYSYILPGFQNITSYWPKNANYYTPCSNSPTDRHQSAEPFEFSRNIAV